MYIRGLRLIFSDINECFTGDDDCDDPNGACLNTIGSFQCVCNPGFIPNGAVCNGKSLVLLCTCST